MRARLLRVATVSLVLALASGNTNANPGLPDVRIKGISGALLENVKATLGIGSAGPLEQLEAFIREPSHEQQSTAAVKQFYSRAPKLIQQALRALGHYNASISSSLINKNNQWIARFKIDPGPVVTISSAQVKITGEGTKNKALQVWLRDFPLLQGAALNDGKWQEAKQEGLTLARNHGYLDSRYSEHEIEVDTKTNTAALKLTLDTGLLFGFGQLQFNQRPKALNEKFLEQYVTFKRGQPYDSNALANLQQALVTTGYFSDVILKRESPEGQEVPIKITLKPAQRYVLSASAGYGTDTGPRIQASWRNRRVNARGHSYTSALEASNLRKGINFDYRIPLANPLRNSLKINATVEHVRTVTSFSETAKIGGAFLHKTPNGWSRSYSLTLLSEHYRIGNENNRAFQLMPGVGFDRTHTKGNPLMPEQGWQIGLNLTAAAPFRQAEPYVQGTVETNWIDSFKKARLLLRANLGATVMKQFDKLPASARFFTGGATSLRGFKYHSVGPKNSAGEVVGGLYLGVASFELQYPVFHKWYGAIFSDFGNAALNLKSFSPAVTAGLGAVWGSPVGPVRIYLAVPIHGDGKVFPMVVSVGADL